MVKLLLARLRHLSLRVLGSSLLQAFGLLWLLVEVTAYFAPAFSDGARSYWWLFLATGAIVGIVRARPKLSASAAVGGTDCSITIRVCDLFSVSDSALIVGTNTTFDTTIEDGTIDPTSVQGQLTARLCNSREQLDRDIAHSLQGVPSTPAPASEKPYGKRERYEIGTVASFLAQQTRVYMVAIATLNAHRVAQATRRDISDALPRLWEYIRTRGGLETLCCPILGSGFSRLDTTREELVREIIRSFIPAVRAGMFCSGLVIAISPDDFSDGHLDLRQLARFLEHESTYGSSAPSVGYGLAIGTPQG